MAASLLLAAISLGVAHDPALGAAPRVTPEQAASRVPADQRAFAACVLDRESGGTLGDPKSGLRARNASSSASGRWQFLDRQWRVNGGLEWMVAERLATHGMPAKAARKVRIRLGRTPIHRWPSWAQDAGFVAALNADGKWSGWRHWYQAGSRCNGYVPGWAR